MADDESTTTTAPEPVDTSTNEDDGASLEDTDIGWDEGEEVPDSEADEDSEAKEPEPDEDSKEDVEEAKPDTESEEAESTDEAKVEDTDPKAEQKRLNDEMAKARIAERQARQEAADAKKAADDATIERYLQDAGDDENERERRELNVEAYRIREEKIQLNHERMQTAIEKAVSTIDLFKTGNQDIQEELANSLDDFERMYIVKDDKGRPVEVKGDVYKYLQAKADSIRRLTGVGARQQDKSKASEQSRTLDTPVRAPQKAKVDADMEGFEEEANRW